MTKLICNHGGKHRHRTAKGVAFCNVEMPWREKESLIQKTHWKREGTTAVWSDLKEFRDLFWSLTRYHIIRRDTRCQYEGCNQHLTLEVHHIIPRRLGGTDHPENLITLCHNHHRIQPAHHHNFGLVLCDSDMPVTPFPVTRIQKQRPECETTLADFGWG